MSKIVAINGDILEENLALSIEDKNTLTNNVTVVFHCAATVKFDEDLRYLFIGAKSDRHLYLLSILRLAVQVNVIGVQRLLKLCHEMKNIAVRFKNDTNPLFRGNKTCFIF